MTDRRRFLLGRSAIGEIAIVIIGVLIALAVDSWWSGQLDAASAERHLAALSVDVETNRESLAATMVSLEL